MKKVLLFIFMAMMIGTVVYADKVNIKLIQSRKDGLKTIKLLVKTPNRSPKEAEQKYGDRSEAKFISNIIVLDSKEFEIDISLNPFTPIIPKNPFFSFRYKDNLKKKLTTSFIITDNTNENTTVSFDKNKRISTEVSIKHSAQSKDKEIWKAKTMKDVIKKMYGSIDNAIEGRIKVDIKNPNSYRGRNIPITITTNINLASFIVLSNLKDYSLLAKIYTPLKVANKIYFQVRSDMTGESYFKIMIIGKDKKGLFYKTTKYVYLSRIGYMEDIGMLGSQDRKKLKKQEAKALKIINELNKREDIKYQKNLSRSNIEQQNTKKSIERVHSNSFKVPVSCFGCHGAHFEKRALGKSKIVKNMTAKEIGKALYMYKNDKNYGGSMKSVMSAQVKKYSNKELFHIAKGI